MNSGKISRAAPNGVVGATLIVCFAVGVGATDLRADDRSERSPGVFAEVLEPRPFVEPRDHGAHPDYATEWWYFTGHLRSTGSEATSVPRTYGFELVFFRVGIDPHPQSRSAWSSGSLYLAHAAITDDQRREFVHAERRSRGAFGEAGASEETLQVKLQSWSAQFRNGQQDGGIDLRFEIDGREVALALRPMKPLVLHGERGMSRKGELPGEASYYSSFTRLNGTGTISGANGNEQVTASAWFDHEVTSSELARGTTGWDWFAVQLDTGEEVMLYQLRAAEGRQSAASSGTIVRSDGSSEHLRNDEFSISILEWWTSPSSGIRYPAKWRLLIPRIGGELLVEPTVPNQELLTGATTGLSYWEGRSRVSGKTSGRAVTGSAYVELVGYGSQSRSSIVP